MSVSPSHDRRKQKPRRGFAPCRRHRASALAAALVSVGFWVCFWEQTSAAERPRVLLIGQGPDGHPPGTHEYASGLSILEHDLAAHGALQVSLVSADGAWTDGPQLMAAADAVVLLLAEGARWCQQDQRRQQALVELAARRGGMVALHWAIGTKTAEPIAPFVQLLGACHGGPDRRFRVLTETWSLAEAAHPVLRGIGPEKVHDEFYYALKRVAPPQQVQPLITVPVEGQDEMVAWAWQRPDGGRSCGFSGLHFHANWRLDSYRRLVAQSVLWSLRQEIPAGGIVLPSLGPLAPAD